MRWFFLLMLCITVVGCLHVQRAVDQYQACIDDPVCYSQMLEGKQITYDVTKAAASGFSIPSVAELVALTVSNIFAFLFGVKKGKKKG